MGINKAIQAFGKCRNGIHKRVCLAEVAFPYPVAVKVHNPNNVGSGRQFAGIYVGDTTHVDINCDDDAILFAQQAAYPPTTCLFPAGDGRELALGEGHFALGGDEKVDFAFLLHLLHFGHPLPFLAGIQGQVEGRP